MSCSICSSLADNYGARIDIGHITYRVAGKTYKACALVLWTPEGYIVPFALGDALKRRDAAAAAADTDTDAPCLDLDAMGVCPGVMDLLLTVACAVLKDGMRQKLPYRLHELVSNVGHVPPSSTGGLDAIKAQLLHFNPIIASLLWYEITYTCVWSTPNTVVRRVVVPVGGACSISDSVKVLTETCAADTRLVEVRALNQRMYSDCYFGVVHSDGGWESVTGVAVAAITDTTPAAMALPFDDAMPGCVQASHRLRVRPLPHLPHHVILLFRDIM